MRLFCFPFAGGSTVTYMPWIERFGDEVELILVQPPGRGTRINEHPYDNMNSLVEELMLDAAYFTRIPYILFGHSLGSRVAFELCCQLKYSEFPLPEYFIASGSKAPHLLKKNNGFYDLPQDKFIQELRKLNGTPLEVLLNQELMELLIPMIRADFKISDTYQSKKNCMPFPILVLNGDSDTGMVKDQVVAWSELTRSVFNIVQLPGDHFFINQSICEVITQVKLVVSKILS
ncbi:thioesterase [Pseudoalteromonas prydzensis]|uniref:Thioesterase n=1 Tax=Pseudoalteromonas prydzensis TaxID=182141 RepID=A0ABR9FLW8_9GAMM|nr:thioesterase [Pseudoalteromonas prydzensis]